jgi:uncharacterized protein YkwD
VRAGRKATGLTQPAGPPTMSFALRITLATLMTALALAQWASVAEADKPRAAQQCADADLEASGSNLRRVRTAVVCLHNQIRARYHLPLLRENVRLRKAADDHSRDMVSDGYFEHTAPEGTTTVDRILRSGYVGKRAGWVLGENLAWGTGSLGTPRSAIETWMSSPTHRANLLKKAYREIGVGVVFGVPGSATAGATYTVDFGVRR